MSISASGVNTPRDQNTIRSTVHGVLVSVFDLGVLILGEPGIGKSGCALELVANGHRLIADDIVDLEGVDDRLVGRAPKELFGLLEIRGLGICDIRQLFDDTSVMSEHDIGLCVEFQPSRNEDLAEPFMPANDPFSTLGISVPRVVFSVDASRSRRVLVETAARYFLRDGAAAAHDLVARHNEGLKRSAGTA